MDGWLLPLLALVVLIIFAVYLISVYNRLQSLRNAAEATLSQIRVAMKKRLDMIEQLVDSVKSYAHFERETFERITRMRAGLEGASPEELSRIEGATKGIVGGIAAVAESYPQLRTSDVVMTTMNAIKDVEEEIARHRYTYNNIIQEFNTKLDTMPSNLVASTARMGKMEYLSFEEDELRRLGYLTTEETQPGKPGVKWE